MKKTIGIALMIFFVRVLPAQVVLLDRVGDLIQAKEYTKALEVLSKTEQHPSTANDARTYYLKAFVYKEQYHAGVTADKVALRNQLISTMAKCRSLDTEKNYAKSLNELERFISASTFNTATELFNSKKYDGCIPEFRAYLSMASLQDDFWLDAHYYIGTAFYELNQYDSAIARLAFVKSRNYDQPLLYIDLSTLYLDQKKEQEAVATIREGFTKYPKNYDIRIAQVNLYSSLEKYNELEPLIESLLKENPSNIEIMLVAATTYEHNKSEESKEAYRTKAISMYEKILAIEPASYDANYNLGVLYYNEAVDIINKNDLDTNLDELAKILEKSTGLFEKSLPYLLKIFNDHKKDTKLLSALQAIYYNLNMKPELNQITALINEAAK